MKMDRRVFTKTLAAAAAALALPSWPTKASAAKLPVNRVTKIRCYYPPNYQSNGPQAFPQSNMVVLVDTEARHHRHRSGRIAGHRAQYGAQRDRQERVRHGIHLATRVHGRVLFTRQGTIACAGRDRSRAVGHQGQGAANTSLRVVRRQSAPAHRTLCDERRTAGPDPAK